MELLRKEQNKLGQADDEHTNTHSPEAQVQLLQQNMNNMQQVGERFLLLLHFLFLLLLLHSLLLLLLLLILLPLWLYVYRVPARAA